jgi:hypothetical protein
MGNTLKRRLFMKKFAFIFLFYLLVFNTYSQEAWKTEEKSGMSFSWRFSADRIEIKIKAPVKGWIAVGFEPENMMNKADIIIGFVKDGEVFIEDHYGTSMFTHRADKLLGGSDNIIYKKGREESGSTELEFALPLSSGDKFDKTFSKGKKIKVILAWSNNDDIRSKHSGRTAINIEL